MVLRQYKENFFTMTLQFLQGYAGTGLDQIIAYITNWCEKIVAERVINNNSSCLDGRFQNVEGIWVCQIWGKVSRMRENFNSLIDCFVETQSLENNEKKKMSYS